MREEASSLAAHHCKTNLFLRAVRFDERFSFSFSSYGGLMFTHAKKKITAAIILGIVQKQLYKWVHQK